MRHLAHNRLTGAQAWAQFPEGRLKLALIDVQRAAGVPDERAEFLRDPAFCGLADQSLPTAHRRLAQLSRKARAAFNALRALRSALP